MTSKPKKENPLLSIAFNILIPVYLLTNGADVFGDADWVPTVVLILALAFPIVYGAQDYIRRRHKNFISLLGIVNILITGGFAIYQLEGIWFALKEAAFPLVMGVAVSLSAYTKTPFMKYFAFNVNFLDVQKIEMVVEQKDRKAQLKHHLQLSTHLFAFSFYISSALNFFLARRIFLPIDLNLSEIERANILNEQIGKMNGLSMLVIALPLMVFTIGIFWHLLAGLKKLTGLELNDLLPHQASSN